MVDSISQCQIMLILTYWGLKVSWPVPGVPAPLSSWASNPMSSPTKSWHGKQKEKKKKERSMGYLLLQLGMDWQTCPHILLHIFLKIKRKLLNVR